MRAHLRGGVAKCVLYAWIGRRGVKKGQKTACALIVCPPGTSAPSAVHLQTASIYLFISRSNVWETRLRRRGGGPLRPICSHPYPTRIWRNLLSIFFNWSQSTVRSNRFAYPHLETFSRCNQGNSACIALHPKIIYIAGGGKKVTFQQNFISQGKNFAL